MTTTYVETKMVPLADLTPFPGNARLGNRKKLVESLEENGQYRSLIVRQAGTELIVLAGNNTMAALEERGDDTARCEIVTCDDQTALRVNLVDNKSNDEATYDDAARAQLLSLLDGLDGTGYEEDEVDALLARFEEEEIAPLQDDPAASYNDDAEERAARVKSHGGDDSKTMESRGIRDIFIPLPVAQADELGRLIMELRTPWGALPQGEILLMAARVAQRVVSQSGLSEEGAALSAATEVFELDEDPDTDA